MVIVTNCPFHVIKITLVGQEDRKIVSIKRLISIPQVKGEMIVGVRLIIL